MATTVAIRFPLGRYHATPWDRSVNEGAAEWPPSPWRLLRALVATWYTRWPDLPAPELDGLLASLGDPPSYRTPPVRPGHTRHYLPGADHKKGEPGGTDLTLDPFLSVRRDAELLVRWDADLPAGQRAILAKLAELVPYLGRADSVCDVRLLDDDPQPDQTWCVPGTAPGPQVRLLAPAPPVSRPALEISTTQVRSSRRTLPIGAAFVSYIIPESPKVSQPAERSVRTVEAVRFAVLGPVPLTPANAVLLSDEAHRLAGYRLAADRVPDDRRRVVLGSKGAGTDHQHAHWIPITESGERGTHVVSLVLWVPAGLTPAEVAALATLREVTGRRGDGSYEVRDLLPVDLLLQAAGPVQQVAPELCGPARAWRSVTPYLPVRHRKREALDDYVAADVGTELRYRALPPASVTRTDPAGGFPDRWARGFRRYRMKEHLGQSRAGLGVRLEFAEEIAGPILLGQLSHFGYGIFGPEPG